MRARLGIAVLSTVLVLLVALVDLRRPSPGPLAAAHAREDRLTGPGACAACHGGWFTSMTEACLDCHRPVEEQLEEGCGLHGAVDRELGARCSECHSEHHGAQVPLIRESSFRAFGFEGSASFDHRRVGVDLGGRHAELACTRCHENAQVEVLSRGETRFLGLDRACASCHENPHEGPRTRDCARCHGQEDWSRLESRGHDRFVPLTGAHGSLECGECHTQGTLFSLQALGEAPAPVEPRRCADCHATEHSARFLERSRSSSAQAPGDSCRACHLPPHRVFGEARASMTAAFHALSGFSLRGPHADVECGSCHDPDLSFEERFPGRDENDCQTCHGDPHESDFAHSELAGAACLDCHDRGAFQPAHFGAAEHERTGFSLTGAHRALDCGACHQTLLDSGVRSFGGLPRRCEGCHGDAHEGFFEPTLRGLPEPEGGTCAHCHATEGFDLADESFDHLLWTGFALEGAHAASACDTCHPHSLDADENGRRFGRACEAFGPIEGCASCHEDPHGGLFDRPPRTVDGQEGCGRCHATTSFRFLPRGFDHLLWTGFPLTGAHRALDCARCHRPAPGASRQERWHALGRRCADCHRDPHAGQFAHDGKTSCQTCHSARAESFASLIFDHDRQSRFPLGEAHAGLACDACHESWPLPEGGVVMRYRPIPHECADCHAEGPQPSKREKP